MSPRLSEEDAPPPHAFAHRFAVPLADIDDLGHATNVAWVRWVQEAAGAHSASIGLDLEAYRKMGVVWVVRRHEIDYLAPAFEDEALLARTWIATLEGARSERRTVIARERDGAVLARARTTWVLVQAATGRPTRVPAELLARYGFQAEP